MLRVTRRQAIKLMSQSALALALSKTANAAPNQGRPRSLIWVWPDGGAPQTDMFDPKPESPAEVRGKLRALNVAGMSGESNQPMRVSECFPEMRKALKNCAVLRARKATFTFHQEAIAAVLNRDQAGHHFLTRHATASCGTDFVYGETPGVLDSAGLRKEGFSNQRSSEIVWDKAKHIYVAPHLGALTGRDLARRDLLKLVDGQGRVRGEAPAKHDQSMDHAYRLMAQGVNVNLSQQLIERYGGNNPTAIGLLTIRELCRQGFSGALLFRDGEWDYHDRCQDNVAKRGPWLDKALAELTMDVTRGVLGDVVLVFCGEFGRTPTINTEMGRDHWHWHTAVVCGGQIKRGVVYGDTNAYGTGVNGIIDDRTFLEVLTTAVAQEPDPAIRSRLPDIFTR